jgi:hypothetical protein
MEIATEYKEIALGAFPDIERAFDRTSFDAITQALKCMALSGSAVFSKAGTW